MKLTLKSLLEADRAKKEKVRLPSGMEQFKDYLNQSNDLTFFRFTEVPKLGVNPIEGGGSGTPYGIYAFPMKIMGPQFLEKSIPFDTVKYIYIFQADTSLNLIKIDKNGSSPNYSNENYLKDLKILKKFFPEELKNKTAERQFIDLNQINDLIKSGIIPNEIIEILSKRENKPISLSSLQRTLISIFSQKVDRQKAEQIAERTVKFISMRFDNFSKFVEISQRSNPIKTPVSFLWDITKRMAVYQNEKVHNRMWRKYLTSLGIDGFIDEGSGLIFQQEPSQAVFFSIKGLKVLDMIKNPKYKPR